MSEAEQEHRVAVRRAWALLNGFDPDELEPRIALRAEEIKADMLSALHSDDSALD